MEKKKLLILLFVLLVFGAGSAKAQVIIGKGSENSTERPQGLLHLQGKSYVNDSTVRNMGFVIPKVDAVDSVKTPQGDEPVMGTLVFTVNDTIDDKQDPAISGGLRVRLNDRWSKDLVEMSNITNVFDYEVYGGLNVRVRKVSAGYQYSLVIGWDDESVYSAGGNASGKTGLGSASGNTATFAMALAHPTKDISAGYAHALAVSQNGEVWSWGEGDNYRTGQSSTSDYTFPMRLNLKNLNLAAGDTVIRCEAGYDNSLLLTKLGKVYYFGNNARYGNGAGTEIGNTTTPTLMSFGTDIIVDIALSSMSGAALNSAGEVYTWGHPQHGRLGDGGAAGRTSPFVQITKIAFPGNQGNAVKIKQVAMGTNHGLAVSEDGKHLYGWGAAQGWGGSVGTTAAVQTAPIDITSYLISGGFNPATESIVYIAASRFAVSGTAVSAYVGGSIIITDKNVYAAGSNNNPNRWGLGYFPKTMTTMYSPTDATGYSGTITTGFLPIYNKTIPPGTLFDQASIGVDHSLLKQSVVISNLGGGIYSESGSYGYGMGSVSNNQLGAISTSFGSFPIPSNIKK
jgi:hypothetical protein